MTTSTVVAMTSEGTPEPYRPEATITDDDRQVVVRQIRQAIYDETVDFEELENRLDRIYQATNRAELDAVGADLPVPAAPAPTTPGHPLPAMGLTLLGDVRVGGWAQVDSDLTFVTLLGDTTIDLSTANLPADATITVWSIFGDSTLILPDGCRASLEALTIIGDRRVNLVDPQPGAPVVRFRVRAILGDVRLYSLTQVPVKRLKRIWKALRKG